MLEHLFIPWNFINLIIINLLSLILNHHLLHLNPIHHHLLISLRLIILLPIRFTPPILILISLKFILPLMTLVLSFEK